VLLLSSTWTCIKIKMLCFMFFAVTLYNFLVTCLNGRILLCFQSINNNKTYEQFCFLDGWLVLFCQLCLGDITVSVRLASITGFSSAGLTCLTASSHESDVRYNVTRLCSVTICGGLSFMVGLEPLGWLADSAPSALQFYTCGGHFTNILKYT